MIRLRSLLAGGARCRNVLGNTHASLINSKRFYCEEPNLPFDNLPFTVTSRYTLTFVFSILFGVGLWAPFLIVWYSMAKRTM